MHFVVFRRAHALVVLLLRRTCSTCGDVPWSDPLQARVQRTERPHRDRPVLFAACVGFNARRGASVARGGGGRCDSINLNLVYYITLWFGLCSCDVCLDAVPQRRTRKVPASGGERWAVYSGEAGNVEAVSIGRAHENVLVGAA